MCFLLNLITLSAQTILPSATIEGDVAVCESGEIQLKIKFEGEFPFGFLYKKIGGATYLKLDPIYENDLVDGYYYETVPVSESCVFELVEVFDGSMSLNDWELGKGSEQVSGTATITVDRIPVPDAGANVTGCGFSYALKAIPQDPTNETFWDDIANGTFNDNSDPNAVFTADVAGAYTLTFKERSGTCIGQDQVTINLQGSPRSTISGETTICSTDGNINTLNASVTLEGAAPFTYKYEDSFGNSQSKYNQPEGVSPLLLQPQTANEYVIVEVKDDNGCFAAEGDMTGQAVVTDNKPDAFAGDDAIVCDEKLYTLSAVPDESKETSTTGIWSTAANGVSFDEVNSATSNVTVDSYGVYNLVWTETYQGCSASDEVNVRFNPNPTLTLVDTEVNICDGEVAIMMINTSGATDSYPYTLDYAFNGNNDVIQVPGSYLEVENQPLSNTSYSFNRLTDQAGCFSDLTDVFKVNVHSIPVADAGGDIDSCGTFLILNAQLADGNHGYWSPAYTFISDINSPNATFTMPADEQNVSNSYELTWTEVNGSNENCKDQQTITVTFYKQPTGVWAGKDTTLYYQSNTLTLDASVHEGMYTEWVLESGDLKIAEEHNPKSNISDIKSGKHELNWIVENGVCPIKRDTIIILSKTLTAPNGFSPNGDGINDYFRIGGAGQIADNKLMVFDVNGKLVYHVENFCVPGKNDIQGWNGIGMDGSPVKDGTYYYIFTGGEHEKKEYLVIKGSKAQ